MSDSTARLQQRRLTPIRLESLDCIVFDFDGVLTDDCVYVDQDGKESVRCTRSDGIAFDILRRTGLKLFILTTETNPVATHRAAKLKLHAVHSVKDKLKALESLAVEHGFSLSRTLYVGNDVNDFFAMRACGYSACPVDAHPSIREIAGFITDRGGGHGVVREIVEKLLNLDPLALWHSA